MILETLRGEEGVGFKITLCACAIVKAFKRHASVHDDICFHVEQSTEVEYIGENVCFFSL